MRMYTSSDLHEHTSPNGVQHWLLQRFHGAVGELVARTNAHRVLNTGCDEGFGICQVLGTCHTVIGLDFKRSALEVAHQISLQSCFMRGSLLYLRFSQKQFDLCGVYGSS